jgi:UDP-glucose:(heptosyl)LPS alpha-1,3-glucosyltransferase
MKLAIVRQKYTPFGGAERFVERALAALKAQGTDVSIIARQWSGDIKGLRVDPFYLGRTWRDAGFARGVQRIIASGQFDLVQSHERIPGCHIYRAGDGVHATWLALRNKPFDRIAPWHRYTLAAEAALFRHPNLRAVICNSRMVRDDIMQRFGLPEDKLPVIYNGVDLEYFHPGLRQKPAGGRPVVLFVGSGFERKGLPTLLEAMVNVDAELQVVGRDKAQAALERRAQELDIADRVRFFGGQPDVRPFYATADICALPTLYDPFPNAALEALACGLPLVTTTSCGAAELITAANGAVVPAGDGVALGSALTQVLAGADRMREAARASVAHLDLAAMAAQLAQLYATLSARPR